MSQAPKLSYMLLNLLCVPPVEHARGLAERRQEGGGALALAEHCRQGWGRRRPNACAEPPFARSSVTLAL
eukprot:7967787-Pyramimonas_sp.AAC.1